MVSNAMNTHHMTTQPKKAAPAVDKTPATSGMKNTLTIDADNKKPRVRLLAELGLSSILPNTNTARIFAKATAGELDLTEAVAVMRQKANAVQGGNLAGLEETLTAQAVVLDAIFNE